MTTKAQTLTMITLAAPLAAAQAQTAATAPAPLTPIEQNIKDIKNPASWMSWGADLRLRNEYFDNAQSLSDASPLHEQDYFRFRGRLWIGLTPVENLTLNTRLAAEPREFINRSSSGTYPGQSGMEWRYGIIDSLNVQWKKPLDLPATLTVGRQDIFLGDGWLVGDGTPADGSWTYFLDAARFTYDLTDQHTTIDAIGILQYARADTWLPILDQQDRLLTDQTEKGAVLSINNTSIPEANLNGYFIYKHDTRVNNLAAGRNGDNGDIFTLGARVSGLVKENLKYSVEGAYQFGEKQDPRLDASGTYHDLSAFGLNSKLTYLAKDKFNNQFSVAYEFLSGDDPGTGNDEMFDILWGRWPRWSELYNVYSYINETRVGQTANLHRIGPGWTCTPVKNLDWIFNYYALFADQDVPTRAANPRLFSGDGNFRGHMVQAVLKYKFGKHMTGHLWSEFVFPGDYYANTSDMMTFLRAELMFTF